MLTGFQSREDQCCTPGVVLGHCRTKPPNDLCAKGDTWTRLGGILGQSDQSTLSVVNPKVPAKIVFENVCCIYLLTLLTNKSMDVNSLIRVYTVQ